MKRIFYVDILVCAAVFFAGYCLAAAGAAAAPAELSKAKIAVYSDDAVVRKAADVLSEEAGKRIGAPLELSNSVDSINPRILLGIEADLTKNNAHLKAALDKLPPTGKDGYKLLVSPDGMEIVVAGHDARGVLYGVGKLLRLAKMRKSSMQLAGDTAVSSTPKYPIRGHEMAVSPRAQSPLEAWAIANFEQYVRELALFGMSSVELSRHIPEAYIRVVKSYGLDVSMVSMYNGRNFGPKGDLDKELKNREAIFKKAPAIDHLLIKSGDPGNLPIDEVFAFAEKETQLLKKYHPKAKGWIAPQHFVRAPKSYFEEAIRLANQAQWLDGMAFGPWCRMPFEEMRAKLRPDLPIRNFPDITHIYSSQYPAYQLDLPMAMTLGRISINPSPVAQKFIHNRYAELGVGSLTYSEGTNDDVNKFLWLDQDWDPETSAETSVRDYACFFFGPDIADDFAKGIFMLEQNLVGPLADNTSIMDTLAHWKNLEARADETVLKNPRFAMALLRAYYDAYIYQRWKRELEIEKRAYAVLRQAPQIGFEKAAAEAKAILMESVISPTAPDLRMRCGELYDAVCRDEGRWTMEYQHFPLMDQIDISLNDAEWINDQLSRISEMPDEAMRVASAVKLADRTDPGEGGFYYNLGDFSTEEITGIDAAWKKDPAYLESPHRGYGLQMKNGFVITHSGFDGKPVPREWLTQVGIYYDQPLALTFEGFDPSASYRMRIAYVGEANKFKSHVRLEADGQEIHGPIHLEGDIVREFDLPQKTTSDGKVTLRWQSDPGERGVHVAEIFFLKLPPEAAPSEPPGQAEAPEALPASDKP